MTKICKCMANCPHGPSPDSPPQIVSAPDVERADDFVRRRKTASGTLPKYWSEWVLLMAEYASSSNAALEQERNLAQSMHRAKDIIAAKLADEVLGLRTERDRLQGELAEISGGDGFRCGMLFGIKGIFEGGCGEHVSFADSYRCSDCTASFHRDCLRKHFKTHGDMVELRSDRDGLREALRVARREREELQLEIRGNRLEIETLKLKESRKGTAK